MSEPSKMIFEICFNRIICFKKEVEEFSNDYHTVDLFVGDSWLCVWTGLFG